MNSFVNQMQSQNQNQYQMGGINFNPYQSQWNMPQQNRVYSYKADPIQGENAAWQFPMGPNSDIWLPDANEDIVWWIRSDMHGNKTVTGFDISLHQKPQPVDTNDLAARLAAVEEWINAKSNKSNAKRASAASATNASGATE